jgi:hypothetical protein
MNADKSVVVEHSIKAEHLINITDSRIAARMTGYTLLTLTDMGVLLCHSWYPVTNIIKHYRKLKNTVRKDQRYAT